MNSRTPLLVALATVLLVAAVWRLGCRSSDTAPAAGNLPPEMAEIETARREKSTSAVPQLTTWAAHDDPRVARAAATALAEIPGDAARQSLQKLAEPSSPPQARAAALGALARGMPEQIDVPKLIAVMGTDREAEARAAAARALAHYSNPERKEALRPFLKSLRDSDPQVRSWAVRGIHNISIKRFLFDPTAEPGTQREQVMHIENRLRELKILQ